jgi:CRP/FNR family transcriptional regulator
MKVEGIPCDKCPLRSRKLLRDFTDEELGFVKRFKRGELHVEAGATVLVEGDASPHLYTVLDGWAFRHKETADGERQILNFALPGDLIGLQTAIMGRIEHSVTALTPLRLCVFERGDVWKIFKNHPELSFDITWLVSREERMLDRNLLSLGQRHGEQRVAYLVAQLADRAAAAGVGTRQRIAAPLRQHHFADALGMTKVHVSRMVQKLRARGLLSWTHEGLDIANWRELCKFADYEPVAARRQRPFI